jgi:hypothetical protein
VKTLTKTKKIMIAIALIIATTLIILAILGTKKIHVEKELLINKTSDEVWNVMGLQFGQVHLWSSNFSDSKPGGEKKFDGIEYSERITTTERGETIQVLDKFDSESHSLSYHITIGMPGIAKSASGAWSLKRNANNETMLIIAFDMEVKNLVGYLLSPIIKTKIAKSAQEIAEELKHYVENGQAHPRKASKGIE